MDTETMATRAEQVARGAAHLDAHFPDGWAAKIDFDTLDMNDWETCIVGQLTGDLKAEDFGHFYVYGEDRLLTVGLNYDSLGPMGLEADIDPELWRAEVDKRL